MLIWLGACACIHISSLIFQVCQGLGRVVDFGGWIIWGQISSVGTLQEKKKKPYAECKKCWEISKHSHFLLFIYLSLVRFLETWVSYNLRRHIAHAIQFITISCFSLFNVLLVSNGRHRMYITANLQFVVKLFTLQSLVMVWDVSVKYPSWRSYVLAMVLSIYEEIQDHIVSFTPMGILTVTIPLTTNFFAHVETVRIVCWLLRCWYHL